MKRNIPLGMGFNPADIVRLRKWAKKIDREIREVRDFSGAENNNLLELWNLIKDAVGVF